MSYFEKITFKPNPGTFKATKIRVEEIHQKWLAQKGQLVESFKTDPTLQSKWEEIQGLKFSDVFQEVTSKDKNVLVFGNGSRIVMDKTLEVIVWENTNPVYSGDCLLFLNEVINYRLWIEGGYALHQIGNGKDKRTKALGWKCPQYRQWYKKSRKLD